MRVFLDANVLFSAAYMDAGSPRALFDLARAGACELVSSGFAIEEARRNLAAKRPERIAALDALLAAIAVQRELAPTSIAWARSIGLPAEDAPILAAAVEAGAHLLVTGDVAHFGALYATRRRGTVVLRPADAIEVLLGA